MLTDATLVPGTHNLRAQPPLSERRLTTTWSTFAVPVSTKSLGAFLDYVASQLESWSRERAPAPRRPPQQDARLVCVAKQLDSSDPPTNGQVPEMRIL